MSIHHALSQHFYLDALDLLARFETHWDSQPRRSSRVKSFVDLMLACECILKAQCILGRSNHSIEVAYDEVRAMRHDIKRLSESAEGFFPNRAHQLARQYFGLFTVSLRYSLDMHDFFFSPRDPGPGSLPGYEETLGNSVWMSGAKLAVRDLIDWGKPLFSGEITEQIEEILEVDEKIYQLMRSQPRRRKN